jgi:hypothetical protein
LAASFISARFSNSSKLDFSCIFNWWFNFY